MSLKVAYLVNQYPKVSHSFIRREILALEAEGISITRFSVRSRSDELVDEADKQELEKTRFILAVGATGLLAALLKVIFTRPGQFLQALKLVFQMGLGSERGLLIHLIYLAEACVLLGWVRSAAIDHVHAHFGTNSTTVALLCRALGGPPFSFTVHGPEEFDKVQAIALPEKIRQAAFVIAISSFGKSQLYRWCPQQEWAKIHIVHCGVDQAFLDQPAVPIPPEPRLVCVGRLCEDKGQMLLVQAMGQLAAEGIPFKLVLVGDGSIRTNLEVLINQLHLQEQIEITGWADSAEVRQQILAARALVLPSFAEGLPVVIMEALALRRPVISTYVAAIPELVQPEETGWLVTPASVKDLVEALRSALQLPLELLEHLGHKGHQRVAQQHDVMVEARKLALLLHASAPPLPQTEVSASAPLPPLSLPTPEN